MSRDRPSSAWVEDLSDGEVGEELSKRGLPLEGDPPSRKARLSRWEYYRSLGIEPPRSPIPADIHEFLDPIEDMRPDSPSVIGAGLIATPGATNGARPRVSPRIPRIIEPAVETRQRNRGTSSAADAYNVMRRWNLNFSGARGSDAEAFLIRIEEGRALIPVSDADLFKSLPFFLSGIALHWFRSKRSQWRTWQEFESAWRSRFGKPDFQFALRDEVMRRTQGEHESVADFLTCMQGMFDRLSPPWRLEEQLNYARRNMLPRLQIAVHRQDFRDFETLEYLATRIEQSYDAAKHYRAPPSADRSVLPDLAYRPPKKERISVATAAVGLSTKGTKGGKSAKSPHKPVATEASPADP